MSRSTRSNTVPSTPVETTPETVETPEIDLTVETPETTPETPETDTPTVITPETPTLPTIPDNVRLAFETAYDDLYTERTTKSGLTTGEKAVITKMINGYVSKVAAKFGHIDPFRTKVLATGRKAPIASTVENLDRLTTERNGLDTGETTGRKAFLTKTINRIRKDLGLPPESVSGGSVVMDTVLSTQTKTVMSALDDLLS